MKFVLAGYGSRGDIEPCAAVALELLRRGHDVRTAVTPRMLGFVESAGLAAVPYGPDSEALLHDVVRMIQNPTSALPGVSEHIAQIKADKDTTLTALAEGADVLVAGMTEQAPVADVADSCGIPLVGLHFFPPPILGPESWVGPEFSVGPASSVGPVEIQAYDPLCFPGLAAQWAHGDGRRPFVGALTLELATDADDDVMSWIAAGTPPIYFGFGSTPITSAADTVTVISAVCAQLGERALICTDPNECTGVPLFDHVKIVDTVNHAAVFPACRAVVHHGGAGTTAAGLRAGIPTLILWNGLDQPIWAAAVTQLKVGSGRRFSESSTESLIADLRLILAPRYASRARNIAAQMIKPAESRARAADLLEETARRGRLTLKAR
jgi:UDP:flavonoid glycosyltransferase YjiC (YdhE family)